MTLGLNCFQEHLPPACLEINWQHAPGFSSIIGEKCGEGQSIQEGCTAKRFNPQTSKRMTRSQTKQNKVRISNGQSIRINDPSGRGRRKGSPQDEGSERTTDSMV